MRQRHAPAFVIGGLTLAACNALTGVSDLGVGVEAAPESDAAPRTEDAATAADTSSVADGATNDAVVDVAFEDAASDPSLIGFWTFDETSGVVAFDKSGKGRAATLSGGATFAPAAGVRGGAVSLGSGQYVAIDALSNTAFPATGSFSIWLRWRTMPSATQNGVVDAWSDLRNHLYLRHANDAPTGELQIALQAKGAPYVWVHTFDVAQDTWAHVVFTWNETTQRAVAYLDGTKLKDAAYGAAFKPDEQIMRLGANFDGWLDEMRLYDRALPEAEALMLP